MKKRIQQFILGLSLAFSGTASQAEEILLGRNEKLAEQYVASRLLSDIYQRCGLVAQIEPLPPARANQEALNGSKHGEVARISAYAEKHPQLTQVTPSYYYLTTVAFAKLPVHIKSKDDLRHYKVGVIRGVAHSATLTEGLENVYLVNSANSLFAMLDAGRIDIAIDTGANGSRLIKKSGFKNIKPVGELARLELFHILAPQKKHLAARISATIEALKRSGELEKLTRKYEQEFLQGDIEP